MSTQFYIDSSQFNSRQAYFLPDADDDTKCCFAGFSDGNPPYASTSIPSGSTYNLNISAVIGYGNADVEKPVINQPIKGKKGVKQTVVNDFDPSGTATGNYSMVHQPWPSTWNVYLLRNSQMNADAFYFNEAGLEANGSYDAYFQVSDFNTSGTIWQMSDNVTWALTPSLSNYFTYNKMD